MKRSPSPPKPASRIPRLHLEEMEPRLLFSADAGALLGLPVPGPLAVTQSAAPSDAPSPGTPSFPAAEAPAGTAAHGTAPLLAQEQDRQARGTGLEIAVVDLSIDDASALIHALEAQRDAGRNIEIFTIGRGEDGLALISSLLADQEDVQAVHVFSHGDASGLQLGAARLDSHALLQRLQEVSAWSRAMATDGDLLLYGCNLAASEEGQALIADLALLSGADVAASDDLTGAAVLGGDWELEFRHGLVETSVAVTAASLPGWDNVLATVTLRDGLNGYGGTTDTFIYTSMGVAQNADKGASTTLEAGEDGTGGQAQLLLKFEDLVGYGPNQIPPGSTITGVTLTIYVLNEPTFTNPSFSIHRMLVPWSGSSTWNSMGDGITTFFPSEARTLADQTITTSGDNTSKTFASNAAMIATVQAWVNDPSTNHGWYTDNGDYSARTTFASSETGTVANRPTLTITYTAPSTTITSDGGGTSAAVSAPENQTAVTTVTATGGMAAFSYAISGGADAARFNIDSNTGVLTFVAAPNHEAPADSDGNNVYQVVVSVSDGTTTDTQTIAVTVTNVNDIAPVLSGAGTVLAYTENGTPAAVDGTLSASDADSSQLSSATVQITGNYVAGQDTLNFTAQNGITGSWNAASGLLTLTGAASVANYQAALRSVTYGNASDNPNTGSRTISIVVNDGLFTSNTVSRTVSVTAVNDGPMITSQGGAASAALNVAENTTAVTTITATDPDGPTLTYGLTGTDAALFSIDNATGALRFHSAPNRESPQDSGADNVYNVTVTVSDGMLSDTQALSITVTDVDEFNVGAVTDSNAAANSVAENAANGSTVGITASAVDADGSNNTITYTLSNNAGGRFAINASTGVVTVANGALLNYEAASSHGITVLATSSDGSTSSQSFTVNLADVDEFNVGAVTDSNAAANSVAENAANGSTVGITASAVDADGSNNTITYTLSNNAGGRFAINASTGVVTVANGALLNYEAATAHGITVLATSSDGSTSSQSFTVNLADVDEFNVGAVTDSNAAANSVAENAANGSTVGITASAVDADGSNNTITYTLSDNAGGRFAIDAATGVVTVADGAQLNFETAASHTITVEATSADGSTSSQSFTIQLADVDEFDVGAVTDSNAAANSVAENAANGSTVGVTASAVDADGSNNTITYSLADSAGGRFAIDSATGIVTVADASRLDHETSTSHSITVVATSSDGSSSSRSFVIAIADVSEIGVAAVSDTDASTNRVAENAVNGTGVGITANAVDPDGDTVSYSLSDNAGGRFAIHASTGVVTVANGALLDREAASAHSITVLATSTDGTSSSQTFVIALQDADEFDVGPVTDDNAAPNTVAENAAHGSTVGITARATDADASGNSVTYTLTDSAGGRFAINAATGVVTVANSALLNREAAASHSITVRATSADGSTSSQSFTVNLVDVDEFNVGPVTDSNGAANAVAENAATGSTVGITAVAADADATNNHVTYSLGNSAGGRFAIDATTGVVTVANGTLLDYEAATSHSITVVATSADGSSSSQSFTIDLADANEFDIGAVSDGNAAANTVAENSLNGTAVGITASATDLDATDNAVTYTLSDSAGGRFAIHAATGVVTVADRTLLDYEDSRSHSITVVATSSDGSTRSRTFTIDLSDDNEFDVGPVMDADAAANQVAENASNGSVVGITAQAFDADGSDNTVTYALGDSAGGRFAIDAASGVVTVANGALLDREAVASHSITVLATGSDGSTSSQTFTINLADVDEFNVGTVSDADASANTVAENAGTGTAVGITATATDGDATSHAITYSLGDSAGGRFAIDGGTGVVTVADGSLLNFEAATSHTITVVATSLDGSTSSQSFTIALSDADEFNVGSVTDANAATNRVAENATSGTLVGITASATDADATHNVVTYALSNSAGGRFAIDAVTGVVTVADGALLNYESATTHTITVRATSEDGSSSTRSFTVNLADMEEFAVGAVSDVDVAANTVAENAATGSAVGITAHAVDPDTTSNTVTYSLSDSAGGRFAIDAGTGIVRLADGSLLNREAAAAHTITVVATSADGSTSSQSFSIAVGDIDEFDVGAVTDANAATNTVAENAAAGSAVGMTAQAVDPDTTSNTVSYSLSDSAGGRFTIDAATGVVRVANGTLLDFEAATSHSITVAATSADGSTSTQTFLIHVTNVNEAPLVAVPTSAQATEQQWAALHGAGWSISDPDAGGAILRAALSVSDGRLSVDAGATGVTVNGAGTASVILSGSAAQLNALLTGLQGGAVTYFIDSDTPPPAVDLTLSVSDQGHHGPGGAQTASASATLLVTPVHDAPSAADDRHATGFNTPLRLDPAQLLLNDRSPEQAPMSPRVVEGPRHGTLTQNSDGRWLYVPRAGFSGTDSFTYLAHDGQADSNVATVIVEVQAAPTGPALPDLSVDPPGPIADTPAGTPPTQGETPTPDTGDSGADPDPAHTHDQPPAQQEPVTEDRGEDDPLPGSPVIIQPHPAAGQTGARMAAAAGWRGGQPGSPDGLWHRPALDGIVLAGQTLDEPFARNVLTAAILSVPFEGVHITATPGGLPAGQEGPLGEILEISTEKLQTVGAVLSVGAVWWAARGATLLTSLLVSTPVWRSLDPLPVLAAPSPCPDAQRNGDEDDTQAERMFDEPESAASAFREIA